jgi:2-polyprenyl-6-methoxyphenol hydroxylase-like FAD-dependent oxidoreductase
MRALVCGAGIAGLTVAGELGRTGWDVTVVESSPARREQGYMIDFLGPGFEAAGAMGLLPRLRELAYPIDRVSFVDEAGRARHLRYDQVARDQGGRLLSLMRPDLELALLERLPPHVEVRFGTTVATIDNGPDGVTATCTDGTTGSADVLVGADGIHSTVRGQVFGPEERFVRQLGFHTCAFLFGAAELHERLGATFYLTDTVDRVAGLYAVRGGRVAMFGAHRVDDAALPADPRAAVVRAYAGLGHLVEEALVHCPEGPDLYYDQVAQVELAPWSAGRVVLAGDACQAVSLLAGQGASLAVAGGRLLAHELSTAPSVPEAFARYERRWTPVVADRQAAGRRAAGSFLPRSRRALLLRRAGLRLMQVPVARRLVSGRVVGRRTPATTRD